jgi:Mycothiol maleylpyruvate isomerase N-terminal domain
MSVDRTFIAENDAERARLRALVTRLNDADLARPMPTGWTIAAILAHLAFWDQRALLPAGAVGAVGASCRAPRPE